MKPLNQNKMTAEEWFFNEIKHILPNDFLVKYEQAKEMEKEQKILLVQQLKNYTYDSQCILGNDDREAIEFVDIFDNETLKSE